MTRRIVLIAAIGFALGVAPAVAHTMHWTAAIQDAGVSGKRSTPRARVGAFYFDGWYGPLSGFQFNGLAHPSANGQFPGRRPLYGWRDNTVESMRTQLSWARQDGISFFAFDWYYNYNGTPAANEQNSAHDNYLKLPDHNGVGFALMYVGAGNFVIPLDQWPAVAEKWVTGDFMNPDYVRIDGKPLLIIYETYFASQLWGGTKGVNAAIDLLQQTAKRHGLPGVFVVGLHQDHWNHPDCLLDCGYEPDLLHQHYDALSKYTFNDVVQPIDGQLPYGELVAAEERNWERYARESNFPFIPSIPGGWDGRAPDERPGGRLVWFTRSADEFGGALRDAINWVDTNPGMRVEPAPAPPVVLIEAWNELQEGAQVLPTEEDGYSYGQAIANVLGLTWNTLHARHIVIGRIQENVVRGTVAVADSWTPCDVAQLSVQRKSSRGWFAVRSTATRAGGSFSFKLPRRPGRYRISTPQTLRYQQTCGAATSRALPQ